MKRRRKRNADRPCAETRFDTFGGVGIAARQDFAYFVLLPVKRALVVIQALEVGALEALSAARLGAEDGLASKFLVKLRRFRTLLDVAIDRC